MHRLRWNAHTCANAICAYKKHIPIHLFRHQLAFGKRSVRCNSSSSRYLFHTEYSKPGIVLGIRDMAGTLICAFTTFSWFTCDKIKNEIFLMQAWKSAAIRGIHTFGHQCEALPPLSSSISLPSIAFQSPKSLFTLRIQIRYKTPPYCRPKVCLG